MPSKYNLKRLAASGQIKTTPGNVQGILLHGGSAASSIALTNDTNGAGTAVISFAVPIGGGLFVDLDRLGGIDFGTAISGVLAGTGAVAYVWYE